jgi:hypothetical protein
MYLKQRTAKAWAKEQGEKLWRAKFRLIALTGLMYKAGSLTREEVVDQLNDGGITKEDLQRFREQRG